eukprot:IDg17237t1
MGSARCPTESNPSRGLRDVVSVAAAFRPDGNASDTLDIPPQPHDSEPAVVVAPYRQGQNDPYSGNPKWGTKVQVPSVPLSGDAGEKRQVNGGQPLGTARRQPPRAAKVRTRTSQQRRAAAEIRVDEFIRLPLEGTAREHQRTTRRFATLTMVDLPPSRSRTRLSATTLGRMADGTWCKYNGSRDQQRGNP